MDELLFCHLCNTISQPYNDDDFYFSLLGWLRQFAMATEVFHLPKSSCHLTHRISNCLRSKFVNGDIKNKSIFAINLKLLPPLHPYHQVGLLSTYCRSTFVSFL